MNTKSTILARYSIGIAYFAMFLVAVRCQVSHAGEPSVTPLQWAHSHNDYYRKRPLLDALDHGFCSVEADLFLVQGKLLVGHSFFELDERRTLQAAYLEPLCKRVSDNGGRVHKDGPLFTLLIDIKNDSQKVYAELAKVLYEYRDMLSRVENGKPMEGAIQVVISGRRPWQAIQASQPRYVGIDGKLSNFKSDLPVHLVPLVSDRWGEHFTWSGRGTMPAEERIKLNNIVLSMHAQGRRVRFWATPETPALWKELVDAKVDHINTDKLGPLSEFLLEYDNPHAQ